MLDEDTFPDSYIRIFGDSIRLNEESHRFFDTFYQNFTASCPQVAEAFAHTDMAIQRNMLKKSLLYSINFMTNPNNLDAMERIAISHNQKHYDIHPELYDFWMDSMVRTVQQYDPQFSADVEIAWRLAFAQCITYMKYMYDK